MSRLAVRVSRAVQRIEEGLLSGAVLGIAALTILNVLTRTLLNRSLAFTEEVSQFLIILVCFVGLSYAASKGRHIRMTALYDQLPPRTRKVFMLVITGSTSLLMALFGAYSCEYVYCVYLLGGRYPALGVPYYLVYLAAPLGLFLASIQYALAFLRNCTATDVYLSFQDRESDPAELSRTEPGRTESGRTESGRTEPGRTESGRTALGTETAGGLGGTDSSEPGLPRTSGGEE